MKSVKLLPVLLFILLSACSNEPVLTIAERGDVLRLEEKGLLETSTIVRLVDSIEKIDSIATHNVKYYKLVYRSTYMGSPVDTEALLLIPQEIAEIPLITYYHGTLPPIPLFGIVNYVPSYFDGKNKAYNETINIGLPWASAGYAVVLPDYIGYGITADKEHQYLYYPEMFAANVDAIFAAKQALTNLGYHQDEKIFLSGWSEGGGSALSTHKYIQEQYADKLTVVATSGLAGPYNMARFLDETLGSMDEKSDIAPIASWAIYAFNKFAVINRPTDQIWSYEVYDQISSFITPSNILSEIFNPYFISKIKDGTDKAFRKAFENCTYISGWTPQGKVFLHHGNADTTVPYFNSADAHDGLSAEGADITLYTYPDGTHTSEVTNFTVTTLKDFNLLK